MKSRVFVASSVEALPLAHSIRQCLRHDVDVTVWSDPGIFKPSRAAVQDLEDQIRQHDFGVFVFAPDDRVTIRGKRYSTARDNVIYELGLFTGWLGHERCFIVREQGSTTLRVPTDLLGLKAVEYERREDDDWNLRATWVCDDIRPVVRREGRFVPEQALIAADPIGREKGPSIENDVLEGLWLSRFSFTTVTKRGAVEGFQFDVEELWPHGQRMLMGRNVLYTASIGSGYQHELSMLVVRDHLLGRWSNVNTDNFGLFQLHVESDRVAMRGHHFGNADDNSVQIGQWEWLRVELGRRRTLQRAELRAAQELESNFDTWLNDDRAVSLDRVLKPR